MKTLILALLFLGLSSCTSNPKVLMKNCTKIHDDYYECDHVEKPMREHGGRNR